MVARITDSANRSLLDAAHDASRAPNHYFGKNLQTLLKTTTQKAKNNTQQKLYKKKNFFFRIY